MNHVEREVLAVTPYEWESATDIAQHTPWSVVSVSRALHRLEVAGLVDCDTAQCDRHRGRRLRWRDASGPPF